MGSHLGRDPKRVSSRRNLLMIGGALGVMAGWRAASPYLGDVFAGDFDFAPIKGAPGFRKIDAGSVSSGGFDPLIGVGDARVQAPKLRGSIAENLHYTAGRGVPVAEFTDYNCPYCKVLSEHVHAFAQAGDIAVSLHHLPLLGSGSREAARFSTAVNDDNFHRRLMASRLRVDGSYAMQLAKDQGRDMDTIAAQMAQIDGDFPRSQALAAKFGIIGTPALVVGRTLVTGAISKRRLARLIAVERSST